ncbi:MAG: glycosyltransferase family 2 protein [Patescibacteria group bacterium]
MSNPVISICIPTFNRAKCLKQCLESIVEQFKDPQIRESVEVVISDNASIDDTESMIKEFQKEFSNIFYYRNLENIRVDRNILNAVDKASGEWVWFLGDDDALFPGAIDYIMQELKLGRFKYCLVNCFGYDNNLQNPAVRDPNFMIESNQYFGTLRECVTKMDRKNLVGYFCGLSIQVFKRDLWQAWPNKQEYIGSNGIHMHILLSAMKEQNFAIISKPLVKLRAANIRWDTFPGLETLMKRARATTKGLLWILETYRIPYSKLAMKIEQNRILFVSWATMVLKKYLFKNQRSRDLIKKLLGKL